MSDTPRTDDAQFGTGRVSVDFARQLERELTAAQAENTRLHADVIDLSGRLKEKLEAIDAAQAEIARLKAGGCARDQRTTQFCGEAVKLQEENDRLRRALERLVESPDNRSLEDFTPEELEAWENAKAVLENTQ